MPFFVSGRPWRVLLCILVSSAAFHLAASLSAAQTPASKPSGQQAPANPRLPTFFLIGDRPLAAPSASPSLASLFDPAHIRVLDQSTGDRNLHTFITDGQWSQTRSHIRSGDVVLFHFAEPKSTTPHHLATPTEALSGAGDEILQRPIPAGEPQIVHTYGWYLRQDVVETIARGAVPILCNCAPDAPPGDNANGAREIATQQRIAFLDLNAPLDPDPTAGLSENTGTASLQRRSLDPAHLVAALKSLPTDPLAGTYSREVDSIKPEPQSTTSRDKDQRSPSMLISPTI